VETDAEVLTKARLGNFTFNATDWQPVSEAMKELVRGLLKMNPKQRLSAEEALEHPALSSDFNHLMVGIRRAEIAVHVSVTPQSYRHGPNLCVHVCVRARLPSRAAGGECARVRARGRLPARLAAAWLRWLVRL